MPNCQLTSQYESSNYRLGKKDKVQDTIWYADNTTAGGTWWDHISEIGPEYGYHPKDLSTEVEEATAMEWVCPSLKKGRGTTSGGMGTTVTVVYRITSVIGENTVNHGTANNTLDSTHFVHPVLANSMSLRWSMALLLWSCPQVEEGVCLPRLLSRD